MNVAYVRVSSADQHEDRQLKALEPYGIEKYFIEKVSGKNRNREQLKAALEFVRDGDVLYVADFSRLARNVRDLLSIAELLKENKVRLVFFASTFSSKMQIDFLKVAWGISPVLHFPFRHSFRCRRGAVAGIQSLLVTDM